MSPRVSIITVCRNSASTIRDTIESVLAQDYPNIEYLIVDGMSEDATLDVVRSYGNRIARVLSEPDRGMYESMNKGLKLATGDIVGFLHSDDVLASPTIISKVVRAFAKAGVECVFGDIDMVSPNNPQRVVRHWRSGPHRAGSLPRGWYPPHVTLYIRRSVLDEVGPFDERYQIAADMDYMVRLFEVRGVHSTHLPEVLVRMRAGGLSNKSLKNIWMANVETWQSLRRHGFLVGPWFIAAKLLRKVWQLFVRRAAN